MPAGVLSRHTRDGTGRDAPLAVPLHLQPCSEYVACDAAAEHKKQNTTERDWKEGGESSEIAMGFAVPSKAANTKEKTPFGGTWNFTWCVYVQLD